jgi:hypothetical protein
MELSLSRVDLLQVGTTSRNTLKLLPLSKRSTQKVVVGDNSGVIHCFGVKKGQASESFVSKPLSKDIGAVSLGGGSKGNNFIFAAAGRTITGFSRKGKPIYEFPCPQTEDIRGLQVVQTEERIFAAGDFVLTEYCKGQEENYFQSNDKINDLLLQKPGGGAFESALACQDRQIRVVRGSQCVQQATVGGPATAVTNFDANGAFDQEFVASEQQNELGRLRLQVSELQAKLRAANDGESASIEEELQRRTRELASHEASAGSSARQLLYGTENGIVGTLSFTPEGLHPGWFIANVKRLGGINALAVRTRRRIRGLPTETLTLGTRCLPACARFMWVGAGGNSCSSSPSLLLPVCVCACVRIRRRATSRRTGARMCSWGGTTARSRCGPATSAKNQASSFRAASTSRSRPSGAA